MTAILKRIDDPRDALDYAKRPALVQFAHASGLTDITEQMPAIIIRKRLRARGLTRITVQRRPLGAPPDVPAYRGPVVAGDVLVADEAKTVDAVADLERQFIAATAPLARPPLEINVLRAEMKRLGIKADRRDNIIIMRQKIKEKLAGGQ